MIGLKEFVFWYTEEETLKAGFEAESLEEAEQLLRRLQAGEIGFDDFQGLWQKPKDNGLYVGFDTLQEVGE